MSHLICSHCGSIQLLNEDLDLENGSTYPCEECRKSSVLLILTPAEYVKVVQFLSLSEQDRVEQNKQLLELKRCKRIIQDTKKFHKKLTTILTGRTPEAEDTIAN